MQKRGDTRLPKHDTCALQISDQRRVDLGPSGETFRVLRPVFAVPLDLAKARRRNVLERLSETRLPKGVDDSPRNTLAGIKGSWQTNHADAVAEPREPECRSSTRRACTGDKDVGIEGNGHVGNPRVK